ncbi:uncharacterized protein LOC125543193 isoform X2 [Triticum urartu]|uniref:uncharacterized protein LOC125543193 isoform X2 n=1 Tax=Triticum urartu TaxID=4572 RepID=UPI00204308DB|nr:uncharacterized protein LOC125543193 isoform X2 [Triticum urartu]
MSEASLVGMVSGKAELNTDVPFTLDNGISRINFIKLCYIVLPWGNWCKIYTKKISSPGLKDIGIMPVQGWVVSPCYLRLKSFSRNYFGPYSFLEGCWCWRLKSARTFFHGSHVTQKSSHSSF